MSNKIEVSIAQGLDVPNIFKDVPRMPKFVLMWEMTFNHYLSVLKG